MNQIAVSFLRNQIHEVSSKIKQLLAEDAEERFIRTTAVPYGIAINTERTWPYIEALAQ